MSEKIKNNLSSCCDDIVTQYSVNHSDAEPALLKELDRQTNLRTIYPRMLSGHLQGRFLKMIASMIHPHNILEIGTFTGYSTLCFAEALDDDAKIYTIEVNPEFSYISNHFFQKSGLDNKIIAIIGQAIDEIPKLNVVFDLSFIDADKMMLEQYYEMVLNKTRNGGIILIDNVLWSGKVVDLQQNHDIDTIRIDSFNKKIAYDSRVENILLPFRDGIMIVRKK